jgi:hypothetical protein
VYAVPRVDFALYKGRSKATMQFEFSKTNRTAATGLCVCCAQPLSSTSSQPLWRSLELTWEIDWCCWAAPIANSTFFYKDCQQYVDGFLCRQESRIHERPSIPTTGLEGRPTAATCPGFRATRPMTVGGNRDRRWTPTQQPPDCFPYFTIDPKLLPLL